MIKASLAQEHNYRPRKERYYLLGWPFELLFIPVQPFRWVSFKIKLFLLMFCACSSSRLSSLSRVTQARKTCSATIKESVRHAAIVFHERLHKRNVIKGGFAQFCPI